jgi:Fe-S oxidoreductase
MAVNMEIFQQFGEGIQHLAEMGQPIEMSPEERVRVAKETFIRKIDRNMAVELESCVNCGQCAEACHFYVTTQDPKYTPIRKLDLMKRVYRREISPLRWLHRLYTRDITVEDLEEWQYLVYDSCTECGKCSFICPMGINIHTMVYTNRQAMANAGLMVAEHRAMAQEQLGNGTLFGVGPDQLKEFLEKIEEQGLEVHVDEPQADVLVLTSVIDILLFHDTLIATIKIMNHLGYSWTFASAGYEAANFGMLSGHEPTQREAAGRLVEAAKACGAKYVIVPECGHSFPALRWEQPNEERAKFDFEVLAISEFLGREVKRGHLKLNKIGKGKKVTYHDPCKVGRHSGVFDEVRWIFDALDVDFRETDPTRELQWCCGGGAGGFVIARSQPLRQKTFELKAKAFDDTGADSVMVSCQSCRLNFMSGAMHAGWQKPIESLTELVADNLVDGGQA